MSTLPVLGYWKIRGFANPIRCLLNYVGQDFEDKYYECGPGPEFNKDCWFNEKFSLGLDFPNLPYYINGDVKLNQSSAILRHIARKHGLEGQTESELDRQEMALEEAIDLRKAQSNTCYNPDFEKLKPAFVAQAIAKVKEAEAFLGDNTWFTGSRLTFVDFVWYELLDVLTLIEPSISTHYGRLQKFLERFKALPAIKQYIESDRYLTHPINNRIATFGNV